MMHGSKNTNAPTSKANSKFAIFADDFGLPQILNALDHESIAVVVMATNRPHLHSDIQKLCKDCKLPYLIQPKQSANSFEEFIKQLKRHNPTGILCHSYSQKIPQLVIGMVNGYALNIHFSLLPKNRGPNPIQWTLIHGETQTGVTLHFLDNDFDTGDIITQVPCEISDEDTWVTLKDKLTKISQDLIKDWLPHILTKDLPRTKQDAKHATKNPRLNESFPKIDFSTMTDKEIYNLIRAQVYPLKGAYIQKDQTQTKFSQKISLVEIQSLRKRDNQDS